MYETCVYSEICMLAASEEKARRNNLHLGISSRWRNRGCGMHRDDLGLSQMYKSNLFKHLEAYCKFYLGNIFIV